MPAGLDTWELLFQKAAGQYMQLKIVFSGNGRLTPRIRALRAYYPRFSYLKNYLPSAYREDSKSASFVERFLANIEGFYTSIEDRIATAQALLDPCGLPLKLWIGWPIGSAWRLIPRGVRPSAGSSCTMPLLSLKRGVVAGPDDGLTAGSGRFCRCRNLHQSGAGKQWAAHY